MEGVSRTKGPRMLVNVIEPNKCIIDDLEILAFENEEQLNLYSVWHEALFDKRRELNAESDRERQIIRNEIARKTRQLIGSTGEDDVPVTKKSKSKSSSRSTTARGDATTTATAALVRSSPKKSSVSPAKATAHTSPVRPVPVASTSNVDYQPIHAQPTNGIESLPRLTATAKISKPKHIAHGSQPLPHGLVLHNSSQYGYNTLPDGKKLLRYKLNKMYNKYRGRQLRRNLVNEKSRNTKIETEVRKSYLTPWLAYCALQALRLPPELNSGMYLSSDPNQIPFDIAAAKKKKKKKLKNQVINIPGQPTSILANQGPTINNALKVNNLPPYHIIYVNPGTVITYSNRINPQQVAEYRQKSHVLPSTATSKKSSAASYDVYEIMDVLANTNKTNVTITRNSHRPASSNQAQNDEGTQQGSIYSHSMNSNTPGIVSTQLHHQARSYLDSMSKFYAEEKQRIKEEEERLKDEPTCDDFIDDYLRKFQQFRSMSDNRPAHPQVASSRIDPDRERHD